MLKFLLVLLALAAVLACVSAQWGFPYGGRGGYGYGGYGGRGGYGNYGYGRGGKLIASYTSL